MELAPANLKPILNEMILLPTPTPVLLGDRLESIPNFKPIRNKNKSKHNLDFCQLNSLLGHYPCNEDRMENHLARKWTLFMNILRPLGSASSFALPRMNKELDRGPRFGHCPFIGTFCQVPCLFVGGHYMGRPHFSLEYVAALPPLPKLRPARLAGLLYQLGGDLQHH